MYRVKDIFGKYKTTKIYEVDFEWFTNDVSVTTRLIKLLMKYR